MKIKHIQDLDLDKIYTGSQPYSEEGIEKFKCFIKENNAFYYAAPDELFQVSNGVKNAEKGGFDLLILDNLS